MLAAASQCELHLITARLICGGALPANCGMSSGFGHCFGLHNMTPHVEEFTLV